MILRVAIGAFALALGAFAQAGSAYEELINALKAGEFEKAKFWLPQAQQDPGLNLIAVIDITTAFRMKGRTSDAIRFMQDVSPRFPRSAPFLYQLGGFQVQAGQYEEALATLERALPLAEGITASSIEDALGHVNSLLGRRDESLAHFRKALVGRTGLSRANILERMGEFEEAAAEFRAVLLQSPNHPLAMDSLAYCLAELNQNLDEALVLAQRVVGSGATAPMYQDTLGWVQFKRGKLEEAEQILIAAMRLDGGLDDRILHHLGAVLDARGVWTAERKEFRELLDSELEPKQLARLKRLLSAWE